MHQRERVQDLELLGTVRMQEVLVAVAAQTVAKATCGCMTLGRPRRFVTISVNFAEICIIRPCQDQ